MLQAIRRKISLRDMPIRHKLLAITLVVALLISVVALAGFQLVIQQSNKMIYTQTAASLSAISDKISSRLNNLVEISLYIAVNREFQSDLSILNEQQQNATQSLSRSKITSLLYRTFHNDNITVSIVPQNSSIIALGMDSSPEDSSVYSRAQKLASEAKGAPVWLSTERDDSSILMVREIYNVNSPFLEPMGLLLFRVDLNKIVQDSTNELLSGNYHLAISQEGERLYPYEEDTQILPDESIFFDSVPYVIEEVNKEMSFITRSHIQTSNLRWDFILSIPYGDVFRSLVTANLLFVICLVVSVLLTILLSRFMLGGINRNISLLTAKMDRVRKGNLKPYLNPDTMGKDELGELNRHFDKMTSDFKKVIEDNYVKQLLLTQTQLKALEQQINPHFLYNSLEAINWFARSGENQQVSSIAQALGRLLRSTLSQNEDCIPLHQELAILDSYLSIQRIRFPDTLRVHMEIDEAAQEIYVPKMSIQPLVENAIIHSLEENIGECHIKIRVSLHENMIQVEVENDGSEIDVDILRKLREHKVQPRGHGIGLSNIDSRIKLLFGDEYGIHLQNRMDLVVVSFSIPAHKRLKKRRADSSTKTISTVREK